ALAVLAVGGLAVTLAVAGLAFARLAVALVVALVVLVLGLGSVAVAGLAFLRAVIALGLLGVGLAFARLAVLRGRTRLGLALLRLAALVGLGVGVEDLLGVLFGVILNLAEFVAALAAQIDLLASAFLLGDQFLEAF